jgi:hypothetical protein
MAVNNLRLDHFRRNRPPRYAGNAATLGLDVFRRGRGVAWAESGQAALAAADTGVGLDAVALTVALAALAETGVGSDAVAAATGLAAADTGVGLDTATLAAITSGYWIAAPELASMRAEMLRSFPGQGILKRRQATPDGQGGETWAYQTAAALQLRLWQNPTPQEASEGARPAAADEWTGLLPYGTTVVPTDRLEIAGVDYEVADSDDPMTEALCVQVALRRVQ